jgi:hypothetical protein
MREYHPKIAARIEAARAMPTERWTRALRRPHLATVRPRRPDLLRGHLLAGHDWTSKFDRTIAFIDITDKYAAYLDLSCDAITVLGQTMPILIGRS